MKKASTGVIGLGMLSTVPSALAAINIRDPDPVTYYGDDNIPDFEMLPSGRAEVRGNTVWHRGNDGSGSGLDADSVAGSDGQMHGAGSVPRFDSTTEGVNNTSEGDLFYNNSDNSLYLNDGT